MQQTIVITGAAGALGHATAKLLAGIGANLILVDRDEAGLARLAATISPVAVPLCIAADVTDEAQVAHYAATAVERFGPITGFFNNAGIEGDSSPITGLSLAAFRKVMAVNVDGVFLGLKHIIPLLAPERGAIVNCASTAGLLGAPNTAAYVASKHAVIGLARAAAAECGRIGARVNCIAPGPIESPMMADFEVHHGTEMRAWYEANTPLGRFGIADEVAAVARFLLSEESSFISGAVLPIDGGLTATARATGA